MKTNTTVFKEITVCLRIDNKNKKYCDIFKTIVYFNVRQVKSESISINISKVVTYSPTKLTLK